MSVWDWPLVYGAGYLAGALFDPVLWTLALCAVLLGRKLSWPSAAIVPGAGFLAGGGALLLIALARPDWGMNSLRVAVTLAVSLSVAGLILLILRTFDRSKSS